MNPWGSRGERRCKAEKQSSGLFSGANGRAGTASNAKRSRAPGTGRFSFSHPDQNKERFRLKPFFISIGKGGCDTSGFDPMGVQGVCAVTKQKNNPVDYFSGANGRAVTASACEAVARPGHREVQFLSRRPKPAPSNSMVLVCISLVFSDLFAYTISSIKSNSVVPLAPNMHNPNHSKRVSPACEGFKFVLYLE